MNARLTLKVIQQGQSQKTHALAPGAGPNGQALVLQASKGARYQLTDALTFTSPQKLQVKRVGQDLLIALQGNDVGTPDIVIRGYFDLEDVSLTGVSLDGQPMVYEVGTGLIDRVVAGGSTPLSSASVAPGQTLAVGLARGSANWFDGGWGLAAIGGGLALAAAAGSGSGNGSAGSAAAGLSKITTYKADPTRALPTVPDFQDAGVTGVDSVNLVGLTTLLPRSQLPLTTAASVQSLVDSFNKVLAEANGSAADATPSVDPSATDYVNLLGANAPASLSRKAAALSLMNDRLKSLNSSEADSYTELKALADAVEALSVLAESAASTSGTPGSTGNLTAAQLSSLGVETVATSLAAVSDAIRQAPDDLSTLGTVARLSALVRAYNTILAEANGSTGDTTIANPTAEDYAAIHASVGAAGTDANALARLNAIIANLSASSVDTVDEINKLAATLDKVQTVAALASGTALTTTQTFGADELRNLGLTGFSGNEIQNAALARKVSDAIRDREVGEVQAGVNTGWRLDANSQRVPSDQTQLERLQTLVSEQLIRGYSIDPVSRATPFAAPTVADWQAIGVFRPLADGSTGKFQLLSSSDAAALNDAIDTLVDNSATTTEDDALVDSRGKLQAIAQSYLKILNEANGSASNFASDGTTDLNPNPTWGDYTAIGVRRLNAGTTEDAALTKLLNSLVAEKNTGQVDSVRELQTLVNVSEKLLGLARNDSGSMTFEELTGNAEGFGLIGITNGTAGNLGAINAAIQAAGDTDVDTLPELQSLVSLTRIRRYADDTTRETPTSADWSFLRVSETGDLQGERTENLAAYNSAADALNSGGITTVSSLQDLVSAYNKLLGKANGTASDTVASSSIQEADYSNIGLKLIGLGLLWTDALFTSSPTRENAVTFLSDAIGRLNSFAVDSVGELADLARSANKVFLLAKENTTATGLGTSSPANVRNDVGLSVDDLRALGFDTSLISTESERQSIWGTIQNMDPAALTYAGIVTEISRYAS